MHITKIEELSIVTDRVHDWWFDADNLAIVDARSVVIRFGKSIRELKEGCDVRTIIIRNVETLNVVDTEKIVYYDLNEIVFDETSSTLTITCGVPISISINVSSLSLEVDS